MKFSVQQYAEALYQTLSETKPDDQEKVINNFIKVLGSNGDLHYYESIISEYEIIDRKINKVREIEVTTANNAQINSDVVKSLNDAIDGDIELRQKVDESLIGGVVVKIEDTLIDASIKGQLNKLKHNLSQ